MLTASPLRCENSYGDVQLLVRIDAAEPFASGTRATFITCKKHLHDFDKGWSEKGFEEEYFS